MRCFSCFGNGFLNDLSMEVWDEMLVWEWVFEVADLSPVHFWKLSATDCT